MRVELRQGCLFSPILFITFMYKIVEGVRFGDFRIGSLLFADGVVLLAPSVRDFQLSLDLFAAKCKAARMKTSTSKSKTIAQHSHLEKVDCLLQLRRRSCSKWKSSCSLGSCSRVRVKWSGRLTGGLVRRPQGCGLCTSPWWSRGS